MGTLKTSAIVLRHANYRDYDRMLTLFSPTLGRIDAIARGCRRSQSTLQTAAEVFCNGEYLLYQKGEHFTVTSFTLQESFYPLRLDVDRLAHGVFLLNLCEAAVQPGEANETLFLLLLHALARIAYGENLPHGVTASFCVQYAEALGYRPQFDQCVYCGAKAQAGMRMRPSAGGVACPRCAPEGETMSIEALAFLREAQRRPMEAIHEVSDTDAREALKHMRAYVQWRIERNLKCMKFLT